MNGRQFYDRPYLLLSVTMLLWSGNLIVGRAVHADLPPIGLAFWRWFMAFLVVLLFARRHLRADWPALRARAGRLFLLSLLGIAAFNTLVYTGLHDTTAINTVVLQAIMPVVILAVSFLLYRDTLSLRQTAGIGVSLLGVLLMVARGDPALLAALRLNPGDGLILLAVLAYAFYSVLLRGAPAVHPMSFLAATFGLGAAILAPMHAAEWLSGAPMVFDRTAFLSVAYVALFPSILAYFCFNRGVALIGANRAGPMLHLVPVFTSALAITLLGETLAWFHLAGFAVILTGIWLASRQAPAAAGDGA